MTFGRWGAGTRRLPALLLALVALAGVVAWPGAVSAHALLRSSQPAAGATLGSAPEAISLTFSETPDLRLTSVKVLDSAGRDYVDGALSALADPPDSVTAPIGVLGDGVYIVSWRTVSSVDGHISAGSFAFGVGVAPPTEPPGTPPVGEGEEGSPLAIAARWLLYLGLVGLLGAAFVAFAVARRPAPDLLAVAAAGWVLAALGTVGVVAVQWAATGAPLEQLPSTSIGFGALVRTLGLVLVGGALVVLAAVPRLGGRRGWLGVGLAASAALVIDVAFGHAAAGSGWLAQIAVQGLHAVAAAAWVGGLAGLLILLRTTPAGERLATAKRFSTWAGVALVLVALTGAVRAIAEVGTLEALVGTDFGRVVIAKTALLVGLAGLGAVNRFINLRDAARVLGGLRRIGGLEIVLAIAVLGLSAWLVNLTPPTSAGGPIATATPPIIATGNDFGTSVRARLIGSPGLPGSNVFDVTLADYDTGEAVDATRVELRFELASQAGVEASTLVLDAIDVGKFRGTGANLAIDGVWNLTATVTLEGGAVEIPMLAVTSVEPQPVEQQVTPDVPTIYTVRLGTVGSGQVYLDPGGPGANELHVTFFDSRGLRADGGNGDHRDELGGWGSGDSRTPAPPAGPFRGVDRGHRGPARRRCHRPAARRRGPGPPACHHRGRTVNESLRATVLRRGAAILIALLLGACGPNPAASPTLGPRPSSPATVRIVEPAGGATLQGESVHIVLELTGATVVPETSTNIRPDEGHLHLYVNNLLVSMNYGLEQDIPVQPGTMALKAEFVAADHAPFSPRIWSPEIVFTVE